MNGSLDVVMNPLSLLNHDSLIDDEAIELTVPFDPRYANPCPSPMFKLVVLAVVNDPYVVEEFVNVWRAVHVLAFPRLSETVLAVPPL